MTAEPREPSTDPLLPVRRALVAAAHEDAERLLADAEAQSREIVVRAQEEGDAIRAEARAQGEADAASALVTERARARRRARAVLLSAEAESCAVLRARALETALDLRADPAYGPWLERMRVRARATLGEDSVVTELPQGGVRGTAPGRRVEYSLAGLAERAVDGLGIETEGLWAP